MLTIPPIGWFFIFLATCMVGIIGWSCFVAWLQHRERVEKIRAGKMPEPEPEPAPIEPPAPPSPAEISIPFATFPRGWWNGRRHW